MATSAKEWTPGPAVPTSSPRRPTDIRGMTHSANQSDGPCATRRSTVAMSYRSHAHATRNSARRRRVAPRMRAVRRRILDPADIEKRRRARKPALRQLQNNVGAIEQRCRANSSGLLLDSLGIRHTSKQHDEEPKSWPHRATSRRRQTLRLAQTYQRFMQCTVGTTNGTVPKDLGTYPESYS